MLDSYPGKVKLVNKNYPLARHRFARRAAIAALASHKQGKYWEFHAKLFEHYRTLNEERIQQIAKELDLDMARFSRDLRAPAIQNLINRDLRDGRKANVRGTPTVFINGKVLKSRNLKGFRTMIEEELKKRKAS